MFEILDRLPRGAPISALHLGVREQFAVQCAATCEWCLRERMRAQTRRTGLVFR